MQHHAHRVGRLHQHQLRNAQDLPVPNEYRKMTDVCCLIVGVLFGLVLFIFACVLYSSHNLKRTNYPADSNGKVCMLDTQTGVNNYPFLYFNNPNDPTKDRHCVTDCPQEGVPTHCYDNCTVTFYANYPSSTRLGSYCLPEDANLKKQLLYKSKITERFNSLRALDCLLKGLGIAFGISIIWLLLVQFLPKAVFWIALAIAAFMLLVGMLVFFIGSGNTLVQGKGWAIICGIVCLALLVLVVLYSIFNRKQIYMAGCFLDVAGDYLRQHWSTLIWVPIFIGLTFLFGLLVAWEYLAFSSSGTLEHKTEEVYYSSISTWFDKLLLAIQTLWGLSFFRDMFNYIISGLSCEWYFGHETSFYTPLKRLFTKNLGSIAGGSFLTSLFFIPAMLIDFLFPTTDCCFCNFFDLTRTDAYAWIYLTGNSFCPSARQTQYLCSRSAICNANQSVISVYTFVARVVLAMISVMIAYWIARDNLVQSRVPPYMLLGVFFACLYVTCYCSDLHAHIAEAILICFLAEYELDDGWTYKNMRHCPEKLRQLVNDVDSQTQYGMPIPYGRRNNQNQHNNNNNNGNYNNGNGNGNNGSNDNNGNYNNGIYNNSNGNNGNNSPS